MRDVTRATESIEIAWMAIPKGVVTRNHGVNQTQVLMLTVMPVFKQESFSAFGPFGSGTGSGNWAAFVKKELASFKILIQPRGGRPCEPVEVALPQAARDAISQELWAKFFAKTTRSLDPVSKMSGAARTKLILREESSAVARTAQEITWSILNTQMNHLAEVAAAASSPATMSGPPSHSIKSLFPQAKGKTVVANSEAPWLHYLQQGYSELGDIYQPPKPSLASKLEWTSESAIALAAVNGPVLNLFKSVNSAYHPPREAGVSPDKVAEVPSFSMRTTISLVEGIFDMQVPRDPQTNSSRLAQGVSTK